MNLNFAEKQVKVIKTLIPLRYSRAKFNPKFK